MVSCYGHCGDLHSHGVTIGIIHGRKKTPLNAIRPCEMDITSNMALDMYGSLDLIIPYLLRDKFGGLNI